MAYEYTKRDKFVGITVWLGYLVSFPLRPLEHFPTEPISNPFDYRLNPITHIKDASKKRAENKGLESGVLSVIDDIVKLLQEA